LDVTGFETNLLTGIAQLLATAGLGVWRDTGIYTAAETGIVFDTVPQAPDRVITLTDYVVFDDPTTPLETAVYTVELPAAGQSVAGPALVEFPGHTVVVPPGWRGASDSFGNLVLGRA